MGLMNRTTALALGMLTSLSALTASRPSEACSMICVTPPLAFQDKVLPDGVKALPLPYGGTPMTPSTLKKDGVEVSTTQTTRIPNGDPMLVPAAPLDAGAYTLEYPDTCGGGKTANAAFTVGTVEPPPTKTGIFHVTTRFVAGIPRDPKAPQIGGCGVVVEREDDHMIADLVFEPAPELEKFLPLVRYDETIVGPDPAANVASAVPTGTFVLVKARSLSLDASCDPAYRGPKQGNYTFSLTGQILGTDATLAPASVDIDLTCPASAGGGANGGGVAGAGTSGAAANSPPGSSNGGGCSASASSAGGGSAWGLLAALGFVLTARCRRARET
jgi:hypothetical protein